MHIPVREVRIEFKSCTLTAVKNRQLSLAKSEKGDADVRVAAKKRNEEDSMHRKRRPLRHPRTRRVHLQGWDMERAPSC